MVTCVLLNSRNLEGHDRSLDDVDTFVQLVLFDDEGRGKADDVTMSGLGQQSVVAKAQAHFPGVVIWGGLFQVKSDGSSAMCRYWINRLKSF